MNPAHPDEGAMSVTRLVQAGTSTMQAAIDAVERFGADPGTLGLRLSVAQLLYLQLEGITAPAAEEPLLMAYREWLSVANRTFRADPDATAREYSRSAAILLAELQLAGSADGNGAVAGHSTLPDLPRMTR
jgi:hypothetical protein